MTQTTIKVRVDMSSTEALEAIHRACCAAVCMGVGQAAKDAAARMEARQEAARAMVEREYPET